MSGFNQYANRFAEFLFAEFPTFRELATLDETAGVDPGSLILKIEPPPKREKCVFWISTDRSEITVGFDEFHTHFEWPNESPIEFIKDVMAERIVIEVRVRDGVWSGSSIVEPGAKPNLEGVQPGERVYLRSWSGAHDRDFG